MGSDLPILGETINSRRVCETPPHLNSPPPPFLLPHLQPSVHYMNVCNYKQLPPPPYPGSDMSGKNLIWFHLYIFTIVQLYTHPTKEKVNVFTLDLILHFSLCVNFILPPYPWTASQLQQCHPQMRGSPHLYSEPSQIVQWRRTKDPPARQGTERWMDPPREILSQEVLRQYLSPV